MIGRKTRGNDSPLYELQIAGADHLRIIEAETPSLDGITLSLGRGRKPLDAPTFRKLRDHFGAWIETENEALTRSSIGLDDNESLGVPTPDDERS